TDDIFYNSGTMSEASVQAFLDAKGASCTDYKSASGTKYYCARTYHNDYPARAANDYCAAVAADGDATTAQMIVRVAKACSVNPQVLLVLIQKEQGLVT